MARVAVRYERSAAADDLLSVTAAEVGRCRPGDVVVSRRCARCGGAHGRPLIRAPGRGRLWASLARSGSLTVVAAARRPVGVDIEDGDPGDGRLRTWVRTEAVLKATGDGLLVDPERLVLGPPEEPPRVVAWLLPGRRPPVRIVDLDLGPGRLAALALVGRRAVRAEVRGR